MLDLVAFIETTRCIDVRNAIDEVMNKSVLSRNKLVTVVTGEAPAKNLGLIGLLNNDSKIPHFLPLQCIIQCEHLVAKYFKYENMWKIVLRIVNLIKISAKIHGQFKNFYGLQVNDEIDELPNNLSLYCVIRRLSTYNVLSCFVEFRNPIITFTKEKNKKYPGLENETWLSDWMFLRDELENLQILNLAIQEKEKNITDLPQIIFSFEAKLRLFVYDLENKMFNHFPRVKANVINTKEEKLDEC